MEMGSSSFAGDIDRLESPDVMFGYNRLTGKSSQFDIQKYISEETTYTLHKFSKRTGNRSTRMYDAHTSIKVDTDRLYADLGINLNFGEDGEPDGEQKDKNKLFSPRPLNEDIYSNVLKGVRYIYRYTRNRLPEREMARWRNKPLTMADVFDFSSATEEAGWNRGGFFGGEGIITYEFPNGIRIMLQDTNLPLCDVDATKYFRISIWQKENYVGSRRIGYINYGKFHSGLLEQAKKFIYKK